MNRVLPIAQKNGNKNTEIKIENTAKESNLSATEKKNIFRSFKNFNVSLRKLKNIGNFDSENSNEFEMENCEYGEEAEVEKEEEREEEEEESSVPSPSIQLILDILKRYGNVLYNTALHCTALHCTVTLSICMLACTYRLPRNLSFYVASVDCKFPHYIAVPLFLLLCVFDVISFYPFSFLFCRCRCRYFLASPGLEEQVHILNHLKSS